MSEPTDSLESGVNPSALGLCTFCLQIINGCQCPTDVGGAELDNHNQQHAYKANMRPDDPKLGPKPQPPAESCASLEELAHQLKQHKANGYALTAPQNILTMFPDLNDNMEVLKLQMESIGRDPAQDEQLQGIINGLPPHLQIEASMRLVNELEQPDLASQERKNLTDFRPELTPEQRLEQDHQMPECLRPQQRPELNPELQDPMMRLFERFAQGIQNITPEDLNDFLDPDKNPNLLPTLMSLRADKIQQGDSKLAKMLRQDFMTGIHPK